VTHVTSVALATHVTSEMLVKCSQLLSSCFVIAGLHAPNFTSTRVSFDVHTLTHLFHVGSAFTPLMFAALNGHASLVRLLLKHGADKEMQSATGQKAVNIAWAVGREDIVKVREVIPLPH